MSELFGGRVVRVSCVCTVWWACFQGQLCLEGLDSEVLKLCVEKRLVEAAIHVIKYAGGRFNPSIEVRTHVNRRDVEISVEFSSVRTM